MSTALHLNPTVSSVCTEVVNERRVYLRPQELHTISRAHTVDDIIAEKVSRSMVQCCSKDGYVLSRMQSVRHASHGNRELHKPTRILTRSPGEVLAEHQNGAFMYRVSFTQYVCNPPIHVVIPAVVSEKNKLGIRCYYYPFTYDALANEVSAGDVGLAGARFLAVFLPKALHCNLTAGDEGDDDESGILDEEAAETVESAPEVTPNTLYKDEERRIEEHQQKFDHTLPDEATKIIVHVRILQKRYDINDRQISAVGVLDVGAYRAQRRVINEDDVVVAESGVA